MHGTGPASGMQTMSCKSRLQAPRVQGALCTFTRAQHTRTPHASTPHASSAPSAAAGCSQARHEGPARHDCTAPWHRAFSAGIVAAEPGAQLLQLLRVHTQERHICDVWLLCRTWPRMERRWALCHSQPLHPNLAPAPRMRPVVRPSDRRRLPSARLSQNLP